MRFLKPFIFPILIMQLFNLTGCSAKEERKPEQVTESENAPESPIGNCNLQPEELAFEKKALKKSFWFPDYYEDSVKVRVEYLQVKAPERCAKVDSLNRFLKGYPENVFTSEVGLRAAAEEDDENVQGSTEIKADYYVLKNQILSLVYTGDNGYSETWALGINYRLTDGKTLLFDEVFYPGFKGLLIEKAVSGILEKAKGQKHDFLIPMDRETITHDIEEAINDSNFYFTKEGLKFIVKSKYATSINEPSVNDDRASYFLISFANSEIETFLNKRNVK